MKESISYTFVLNIIIIFIFICFAIIMGIFSYYRAFKANTIIINSIERNEGYNCISAEEAGQKLNNIGYSTPFNVECKTQYGSPCMTDENRNYAVISYNLDYEGKVDLTNTYGITYKDNITDTYRDMNTPYKKNCITDCNATKYYQYGVYTYMYVDMPIISKLLKVPVYSKTKIMYEHRNFYINNKDNEVFDKNNLNTIFDTKIERIKEAMEYDEDYNKFLSDKLIKNIDNIKNDTLINQLGKNVTVNDIIYYMAKQPAEMYVVRQTGGKHYDPEYNARSMFELDIDGDGNIDMSDTGTMLASYANLKKCGYIRDYSKY